VDPSVDHPDVLGVGVSGEFSMAGGVSGGLTAFVMTPDLLEKLCCGSVAGGVKFCTLGATACGFTTHVKRVAMERNHLYVSGGQNSAFTHHHVPVAALAPDQVSALLKEQHSKED
jgi:hypothetical protein